MTRAKREGEAGFSMVEVIVTVSLLSLVMASVLGALVTFQRAASAADHRVRNLEQTRVIMAVATKDLRTATTFSTATAGEVVFLGNLNTANASAPPNRIRLYVDTQSRLLEAVTQPDAGSVPTTYNGTPTTRVVGTSVVNGTSMFGFLDAGDPPAATATLGEIAIVTIQISVRMPSSVAPNPTTLSTAVWLPNVAAASENGG